MADNTHVLSPDTQAILLLCGNLRAGDAESIPPLTLTEYNQLAQWLRVQAMRPGDLLDVDGAQRLHQAGDELQGVDRMLALLSRGGLLALQVEAWTNQGLWVISRSDEAYPQRLKDRLKHSAPAILYGAGNPALMSYGGLALVGSRHADVTALEWTATVAQRCVREGMQVISGGARGVDQAAMLAALEVDGNVIGILADSLSKASVSSRYRSALREGNMTLVSPYAPHAGFNVGNAMGRNKLIYALSDWTLVVNTDAGKGGTWSGATEALKHRWVPVMVRVGGGAPPGNQLLIEKGAIRLEATMVDGPALTLKSVLNQLPSGQTDNLPGTAAPGLFDESITAGEPKSQSEAEAVAPIQTIDPDTFWSEMVWPLMSRLANQEGFLNRDILCSALGIKATQADDWLKRAVDEGRLQKKRGPVRYVVSVGGQMSLLGPA